MDKYRSQISLHRKYRQANITKTSAAAVTTTTATTGQRPSNSKYHHFRSHNVSHEESSHITVSTASASFDGSAATNTTITAETTTSNVVIHDSTDMGSRSRSRSCSNNDSLSSARDQNGERRKEETSKRNPNPSHCYSKTKTKASVNVHSKENSHSHRTHKNGSTNRDRHDGNKMTQIPFQPLGSLNQKNHSSQNPSPSLSLRGNNSKISSSHGKNVGTIETDKKKIEAKSNRWKQTTTKTKATTMAPYQSLSSTPEPSTISKTSANQFLKRSKTPSPAMGGKKQDSNEDTNRNTIPTIADTTKVIDTNNSNKNKKHILYGSLNRFIQSNNDKNTQSTNQKTKMTKDASIHDNIKNSRKMSKTANETSLPSKIDIHKPKEKQRSSYPIPSLSDKKDESNLTQSSATSCHQKNTQDISQTNQSQTHNSNSYMVPTEAQLRWAQFHFKKRAQSVQNHLEELMLLPLDEKDVDGALSGDGDSSYAPSSCSDNDSINSDAISNSSTTNTNENDAGSSNKTRQKNDKKENMKSIQKNNNDNKTTNKRKKRKKRKKFKLSRGRRALLRVSARRMEERRKKIQIHGFLMQPDSEYDDLHHSTEEGSVSHRKLHNFLSNSTENVDDNTVGIDEITEALHVSLYDDSSFFTERRSLNSTEPKTNGRDMGLVGSTILSGKKKKKSSATATNARKYINSAKHLKGKRSMVSTAHEDEERMKRFEEAYLAMCNVTSNQCSSESDTVKPSKRWTRGSHIPVAVSIDGRIYDDLQRSPAFKDTSSSRRYAAQTYGAEVNEKGLADRGASWMMHLPKSTLRDGMMKGSPDVLHRNITMTSPSNRNEVGEIVVSPQKLKLMELVDRLQAQEQRANKKSHQSNKKRKDTVPKNKPQAAPVPIPVPSPSPEKVMKKTLSPFNIGANVSQLRQKLFRHADIDVPFHKEQVEAEDEEKLDKQQSDTVDMLLNDDIEDKIHKIAAHVNSRHSVIDTDAQSVASSEEFERRIQSLMLSPTIITKRLNQAIRAIESYQWDQVSYLVNANPWLAEMPDIRSNQYLLHKLAFHGVGNLVTSEHAPPQLHEEMLNACPVSIHKFDHEGNLPLHMAAAAGNIDMILRLSERFPGGASVRNNKGHLPLHMALLACSNAQITELEHYMEGIVKVILELFPGGLSVADNDGNLPIHYAACNLTGSIGAEVTQLLLNKAEELGDELRFPSGVHSLKDVNENLSDYDVDNIDEDTSILVVRNSMGWTPLMSAVKNQAGWQVLDVLLDCDEIEKIMFDTDENGKNILQLTLEEECYDPPSTLSILKFLPKLVTKPDFNGALPIETACIRELQQEIIMAIALLDLPIDLDSNDLTNSTNREEYGGSWWYLNCDCDDAHVKIVKEILEICDYQQKRALCFAQNEKGRTLLRGATPKCKEELRKALRFVGRYEFIGSGTTISEDGPKIFEALDFGTDENPIEEGQKVLLEYYGSEEKFSEETSTLQQINLQDGMLVKMQFFHISKLESSTKSQNQFCVAIDAPILSLSSIVSSMDRNKYMNDHERINRYIGKLTKVFWMIGEGIHHLHKQGVVHGHIDAESCGKFDDGWKILNLIGSQQIGKPFSIRRVGHSIPPEALQTNGRTACISAPNEIIADTSIDIFSFGKLMYEVFTGKQLIPVNSHKMVDEDENFLRVLKDWNEENLYIVVSEIESAGAGTLAADLISHCLCPFLEHRPKSMKEVLAHSFWSESKNFAQGSNKRLSGISGGVMKRRFKV